METDRSSSIDEFTTDKNDGPMEHDGFGGGESIGAGSSGNLDENGGNDPPSFQNDENDEKDENDKNDENNESDKNDKNDKSDENQRREPRERRLVVFVVLVVFVADQRKLLFPLK